MSGEIDSPLSGTRLEGPRRLMLAILADALDCYQRFILSPRSRHRRLFREADRWLFDRVREAPVSFHDVCDSLGLEAGRVQARLRRWRDQVARATADRDPTMPPPVFRIRRGPPQSAHSTTAPAVHGTDGEGERRRAGNAARTPGPGKSKKSLEEKVSILRSEVLGRARILGNVSAACREAGISRTFFYRWRRLARLDTTDWPAGFVIVPSDGATRESARPAGDRELGRGSVFTSGDYGQRDGSESSEDPL